MLINFQPISGQELIFSQGQKTFPNFLKLTAAGNGYSDQTIVVFIPGATTGFDPEYDAYKLFGIYEAPQLYSILPGLNLSVNALPEININHVVQLGFQVGANTSYTLSAINLYTFDPSVTIFLDDTRDDVITDLRMDSVYTFTAATTDDEERFRLYFRYPVYLNLTVNLEGVFNGVDMNTGLNDNGLIPLNQPYNLPPWNYSGTESVSAIPNADVVDWVLVEIRDAPNAASATSGTMVERAAGFLLKNGSVVGTDGLSHLVFRETIEQNLFVVVWHRNHLGVMTSASLIELGGLYSYDFTTGSGQAYGTGAQKDLGGGVFGLFGGDGNADGVISITDLSLWPSIAGETASYELTDYNLDGQFENKDKNDTWFENIGQTSQLP